MHTYVNDDMKKSNHVDTHAITKIDLIIYEYIINGEEISFSDERLQNCVKDDVLNRMERLLSFRTQLEELKKLPLIRQRTIEWLDARKTRLTASDLEDALKANNLALAKKKAGVTTDTINYNIIKPLKWGTMYEAMAMRCYSQERNDIGINEFGLIIDQSQEHFGASPDGISELGIMIEIKCPYSRQIIDGVIPHKYYMQMQGQLAVCNLQECDYIECQFIEYGSPYLYIDSIENEYGNCLINHGIIAEYRDDASANGDFSYIYSDPYLKASDALNNINKKIYEEEKLNTGLRFLKLTAWRLEKINVQKVYFDEEQWKRTLPGIDGFWKKVEECKKLPKEEPKIKTQQKYQFIPDDD